MSVVIYSVMLLSGIVLAGYFSGVETGAYVLNKLRLRMRVEEGNTAARILEKLLREPQVFIVALLIGTNASIYLATVAMAQIGALRGWRHPNAAATLVLAPVLLVFAEAAPKNIFRRNATPLLLKAARATMWILLPVWPVARVLTRLISVRGRRATNWGEHFFSRQRLKFLFIESAEEGVLTPYQNIIAHNILSLRDLQVKSVMIPIARVVAVPEGAGKEHVLQLVKRYKYSRFPVCRGHKREVVGIFNVLDLLGEGEFSLERYLRKAPTLSPWDTVGSALFGLRQAKQPMGIVADNAGRALGLVTVKDLVEEIVGELGEW